MPVKGLLSAIVQGDLNLNAYVRKTQLLSVRLTKAPFYITVVIKQDQGTWHMFNNIYLKKIREYVTKGNLLSSLQSRGFPIKITRERRSLLLSARDIKVTTVFSIQLNAPISGWMHAKHLRQRPDKQKVSYAGQNKAIYCDWTYTIKILITKEARFILFLKLKIR